MSSMPTIPNEIYIHIFELLVPPNEPLESSDLQTLARLGRVCRSFANLCLPRLFQHLKFFSTEIPDDLDAKYNVEPLRQLLSLQLFSRLASNEPAALTLAKNVWRLDLDNRYRDGTWGLRRGLIPRYHLSYMLHMTNIRQLVLQGCLVDIDHWRTFASLPLLEELRFLWCSFLPCSPSATPEKMNKLELSLLEVVECDGRFQPMAPIDPRGLRTLTMDLEIAEDIDWLPQSSLTELSVFSGLSRFGQRPWEQDIAPMRDIVMQLPYSIQTLSLYFHYLVDGPTEDAIRYMFDCPAWSTFRHLRSLTLKVIPHVSGQYSDVLSVALDGIGHHNLTGLQSLVLENPDWSYEKLQSSTIRSVIRNKLGPHSSLTYVEIHETALRLVDGEWLEVEQNTA